ncbi:MAG: hypothetical protein ACXW0U_07290, partial [Halobacteriota archaeon]
YFHNIGRWGGPNDQSTEICSENTALQLTSLTSNHKMKATPIYEYIKPHSTCYAASPHSVNLHIISGRHSQIISA